MKKLLLGILVVITLVSLTACSFNKKTELNSSGDNTVITKNGIVYNNGDEYIYSSGNLYFRMYEAGDFEKDFTGSMYCDYNSTSEDRAIAKINISNGSTVPEVLFKNDSRGKFYLVDSTFFFSNDEKIYATDMNGNVLHSYENGKFKTLDVNNHKLEIYKDDGIYEIDTLNFSESKKMAYHYEYTLEKIDKEFFNKNMDEQYLMSIYLRDDKIYYYYMREDTFEVYCFDYLTLENKKVVSLSNTYEDYSSKLTSISFIADYEDKIYVYKNAIAGTIGNTIGYISLIDQNGYEKELVKIDGEFVKDEVKGGFIYLELTSPGEGYRRFAINMHTTGVLTVNGEIQKDETDTSNEKYDNLVKEYFNSDKKRQLEIDFKAEDIKRQLNNAHYTGIYSDGRDDEELWKEIVIEQVQKYDCEDVLVYEYDVAIHGYISWRGEYYRIGIVYVLVNTTNNDVKEIYRVSLYNNDLQNINVVNVPDLVLNKDLEDAPVLKDEYGKYVKLSENYKLSNVPYLENNDYYIWNEKIKNNKREILPSKIYLVNADQEYLYEYNGTKYNVPIEKCNSFAEERVEYKDYNIQHFFNIDMIKVKGTEIVAGEHYSFEYISDVSRFDNQILKIYEMDFDNNLKTKEIVVDYNLDNPSGASIFEVKIISINENGEVRDSGIMCNCYTNIKNYRNVFYGSYFAGININDYIEEYFLCKYYIYDKDDGVISVYRYANGDVWGSTSSENNLSKITFTLKEDVRFSKSQFGEYNGSKVDYILDWDTQSNGDDVVTLSKGTKIHILEIVDSYYGDTIIETEDGTKYILMNMAGRIL